MGFIDQTLLNIKKNDTGGEADPHGADLRGNPLGALVYSTAFSKDPKVPVQVTDWTYFVGSDVFCFKACDPAGPDAARLCERQCLPAPLTIFCLLNSSFEEAC